MQIINQAKVTFEYRKSHSSPIIIENVNSNIVVTYVVCHIIHANKRVNKHIACTFDILTYDIVITNTGDYPAKNIFLKDIIPKGTYFIFNSIKVNGKNEKCKDLCKGIWIDKLECGESATITFEAIVNCNFCIRKIINYACISYDYKYNIEEKPVRACIKTNKVYTLKKILFKSINVKSIINVKKINIITNNICKIYTKVEVLNAKIINGLKNNMILVLCKINYEIQYKQCLKIYKDTCSKGFSEVIFVPNGVNYYDDYLLLKCIKLGIESSDYMFLSNDKIVVNSQILIRI